MKTLRCRWLGREQGKTVSSDGIGEKVFFIEVYSQLNSAFSWDCHKYSLISGLKPHPSFPPPHRIRLSPLLKHWIFAESLGTRGILVS